MKNPKDAFFDFRAGKVRKGILTLRIRGNKDSSNGDYEFVRFSFEDFAEMSAYVDLIKARSTFDSDAVLQPGDRLVSLCTCNYDLRNGRYMLLGRVARTADEN